MSIVKDTKLILILVLGAILRIWNADGMNYHHDELSALLRCRFESLTDLINFGVIPDGHPALTQVFLWFWTNLVGMNPVAVKLPFILAGILSIWLLYQVSMLLFDYRTALVGSTLFAVLQYAVVYSQWARPYAFGTLFLLLALFFLMKYQSENTKISLLGFAIALALTAYTHYFALLTLLIFIFSYWVFFLNKTQKLHVLAAGLGGFLFWVPHLSITLHHLSLGGLGDWLDTPSPDYWIRLISYTFHYNYLFLIPIGFSIIYFLLYVRTFRVILLNRLIVFITIILTYLVAYFYSIEVEPLLHYGTMSFTVPFVCMLIGSLLYKVSSEIAGTIIFMYALIGVHSLVVDRDHYQLNYHTAYGDAFSWSQELDVPLHFDLREDAVKLLQQIGEAHEEAISIRQIGYEHWSSHLQQSANDTLLIVTNPGSPPEILAAAIDEYPCFIAIHEYHTTATYLLSRGCELVESSAVTFSKISNAEEYSKSLDYHVDSKSEPQLLVIRSQFNADQSTDGNQLVLEYEDGLETLFWRGSQYQATLNSNQFYSAATLIDSRDLLKMAKDGTLKIYAWNRALEPLSDVHISLSPFHSNSNRYRLFEQ